METIECILITRIWYFDSSVRLTDFTPFSVGQLEWNDSSHAFLSYLMAHEFSLLTHLQFPFHWKKIFFSEHVSTIKAPPSIFFFLKIKKITIEIAHFVCFPDRSHQNINGDRCPFFFFGSNNQNFHFLELRVGLHVYTIYKIFSEDFVVIILWPSQAS